MLAYIVRRVLATIPVMAIVALFVFSLLYIAPGDPAGGDRRRPGLARGRRADPRRASASTARSSCASASGPGTSCRAISARRSSPACR